jgi:hypothetical protein
MEDDDHALSFLGSSLGDRHHLGHRVRTLILEPGDAVDARPADWADVLVVVERGRLQVECDSGARAVFEPGAVLVLTRLELRCLRSVGTTALVVTAVSRCTT